MRVSRFHLAGGFLNATLFLLLLFLVWRVVDALYAGPIIQAREHVWPRGIPSPIPAAESAVEPPRVLVLIGSRCEYCLGEMAFYRRLEGAQSGLKDASVEFVGFERSEILRDYLIRNGIANAKVRSIPQIPSLSSVPTIIALDSRADVLESWEGVLSASQEEQVLRFVR
jgi:hypothetical protein